MKTTEQKITKTKRIGFLKWMLSINPFWAVEAMLRIHDNQETDEKQGSVKYSNGIGFNEKDAELLCKLANGYKSNLYLEHPKPIKAFFEDWQLRCIFRKMPKYSKQLIDTGKADIAKLDEKLNLYAPQWELWEKRKQDDLNNR